MQQATRTHTRCCERRLAGSQWTAVTNRLRSSLSCLSEEGINCGSVESFKEVWGIFMIHLIPGFVVFSDCARLAVTLQF